MRRLAIVLALAAGVTMFAFGQGFAQPRARPAAPPPAASTGSIPAAPTQTVASALDDDPYIKLMSEIAVGIDSKCLPPGDKSFQMVIFGVLPQDARFSPYEKDYLYLQLRSAAAHVYRTRAGVKQRMSISDVGEALTLMGIGSSRDAVQEFIEKSDRFDIGIQISGGRQIDGRTHISLIAHGRRKFECFEATSSAALPVNAFPEQVFRLEELLARSPAHVLEHSQGKQIVQLRTRMGDNSETPEIWRESMLRAYERSISRAKEMAQSKSLGAARDIIAEPTINHIRRDQWQTDIVMSPNPKKGFRLEVGVKPPEQAADATSHAFSGMVDPDSFPPQPLPATGKSGVSKMQLPLSLQKPERVAVTMGGTLQRIEIPFAVPQSTAIEIEIEGVEPGLAPEVMVLDRKSQLIKPDFQGRLRPTLRRWRLERGGYSLTLTTKSNAQIKFQIRTRAAFDSLVPEPAGRIEKRATDWIVGVVTAPNGQRACYAYTPALMTEPVNWRMLAPQLYFQMFDREGSGAESAAVAHYFDESAHWRSAGEVAGEVRRNNVWQPLRLTEEQGRLKSLSPCPSDATKSCLRQETLYELTNGNELRLFGPRKDGQRGTVVYSLNGYQNAMSMAASMCGQRELAGSLIEKRMP